MIFSDLYKNPRSPLSKFRHPSIQLPTPLPTDAPDWVAAEYADLLSRDKAKQKEAVKRYLAAKVRNDWEFPWPSHVVELVQDGIDQRISAEAVEEAIVDDDDDDEVHNETKEDDGYQVDSESDDANDAVDDDDDAQSIYSTISEDPLHYRPRMEWTSDLSDDEETATAACPFRFDNPDAVGPAVQASILVKRAQRRRAVRKETEWNQGLACFEARRNAWTGARTVRVRSKPATPPAVSPRSPRRFFFRRSMSGSPPTSMHSTQPVQQATSGDGSDASSLAKSDGADLRKQQTKDTTPSTTSSVHKDYPVETLLPIAPPLLPPNNPIRASITPSMYLSLYEKLIIHNLQPSCPINLADMLRACVSGWKRDGEWPPRPTPAEPSVAARKKPKAKPSQDGSASGNTKDIARRMSFGLLGRDKDDDNGTSKGIRRSLQRALGLGVNGAHEAAVTDKA